MIVNYIKNKLGTDTRSSKYAKNVFLLLVVPFFTVLISFLLVPMTLNRLGLEEYGVWVTILSLVGWLTHLDFGLGNGLRNKYATAKAEGNLAEVRQYVSTAFIGLVIISSIIALFFFIASPFIDWSVILNAPERLKSDINILILVVIGVFCIKLVFHIISILLIADQEPAIPAILGLMGSVLSLCSVYLVSVFFIPSLLYIGIALIVSQIVPLFFSYIYFFSTRYKDISPKIKYFSIRHIKSIFSLGIRFFLIQLTAIAIYQTNTIIIAHTCGLNEVTEYNLAYKYINIIYIVFTACASPLWSASTEAFIKNEIDWIKSSILNLHRLLAVFILFGVFLILISSFFYKIWFKSVILPNNTLLTLLLVYTVCMCRTLTYRSFMNGVGKITLQFYVTLLQSFLHIPLAYYLGKTWGIYGVIAAMLIWAVINNIWEPIQFQKIILKKAHGLWNK